MGSQSSKQHELLFVNAQTARKNERKNPTSNNKRQKREPMKRPKPLVHPPINMLERNITLMSMRSEDCIREENKSDRPPIPSGQHWPAKVFAVERHTFVSRKLRAKHEKLMFTDLNSLSTPRDND